MRAMSAVLALVLTACGHAHTQPIPIDATAAAISQLNGKWVGEYSSPATGRRGSIVFDLSGDQNSARGDVIMYSAIVNVPADRTVIASANASHAADVLSISFVRAADDVVTGRLAPYRDPNTGATMSTTFTGRMAGDTIEGSYESLSSDANTPVRGRWRVKRTR